MDFLKSEIAVDFRKTAADGAGDAEGRSIDMTGWATDDVIQPFMIDATGLHGRYVRLGPQLDAILSRHAMDDASARLLGEFLALAVGLASALKYDGIFTLQVKGDGPVPIMVADVSNDGDMRGYAQIKGAVPSAAAAAGAPVPKLLGAGYLAFTVDFSTSSERYQGIVSLDGATLSDVIDHYFEQSAQFAASAHLACNRDAEGHWRAGALIVQHLPPEGGGGGVALGADDWNRAVTLMKSATEAEMLDPALDPGALLYRLYNEDGVRVFQPKPVRDRCRCSDERMLGALAAISEDEVRSILNDGKVEMTCEFCNTHRSFSFEQIFGRAVGDGMAEE
ncbi:MAG: Hsp33 family molecular chaperone HslO [Alphaproteobacteria bacterium]|nr:Hsp33 family molecular chaperone HslO [Alphaproteobacteria bacterium]